MIKAKREEMPIDRLLGHVQKLFKLKSKTATILFVGSTPCIISRIRNDLIIASPEFVLRFHDKTGMSIEDIRRIAEIPKLA
jgi:hypothetical protein